MLYLGKYQDLLESLPPRSIDLVLTDPPYLFDNGRWHSSKVMGSKTILGKGSIFDTSGALYKDMSKFGVEDIRMFLDSTLPKLRKPNMYICCSDSQVPIYGMWARENQLHFQILVWEKPLSIINKNRFSTNVEFICRIYDFGTSLNRLSDSNLYNRVKKIPLVRRGKIHPTQKPVELFEQLVMLSSKEGDTVFDPFMGSGTSGVAALRQGRYFIGAEVNPTYFEVARNRLNYVDVCLID